jgi:stearoyl-CoA desaturase (delta-9 desaturase)
MDLSLEMFTNIPKVLNHHYKEGNFNWPYMVFFAVVHITAFMGIFKVAYCKRESILFFFILWQLTGYGITCGAHRLWAHKSYEAHFIVRFLLMIGNSVAYQGSIYSWAINHRIHHKYSETSKYRIQYLILLYYIIHCCFTLCSNNCFVCFCF